MRSEKLVVMGLLACFGIASCNNEKPRDVSSPQKDELQVTVTEGYPIEVIQALTERQNDINRANPGINSMGLQSVIAISKIRDSRRVVTVAFKGGSPELRQQIADAVKDWISGTSLRIDFGNSAGTNSFREWSTSDASYKADIRISFDQAGYWSLVGTDGTDPSIVKAKQASMNFGRFDQNLPTDWRGVVLHEFGHALGFEHEHQSPVGPCEAEFRWNDDPGYVKTKDIYGQFTRDSQNRWPGIYTLLGGFPNKWSKDQIDFNLRRLPDSVDWRLSDFDKLSIMKYYFDKVFFKNGEYSGCYSKENVVLSDDDKKAVAETYPRSPADAQRVLDAQLKANKELLNLRGLPADLKSQFTAKVSSLAKHQ
jgi:hypothetical protein